MGIKIVALFEQSSPTAGWAETLYYSGSDLGAASDYMVTYWPLRLAIAPSIVSVVGGRASVIGQRRTSKLLQVPTDNTGTYNSEDITTEPWSALQYKLSFNFSITVTRFWHGIPQSQVTDGKYTPVTGYKTAVTALLNSLKANTMIYAKDPTDPTLPKNFYTPTDGVPGKLTSHRVGRPFDLLVGRRLL